MKILYILKQQKTDTTVSNLIAEHQKSHEVSIVNLTEKGDYNHIVDLIMSHDRVITW